LAREDMVRGEDEDFGHFFLVRIYGKGKSDIGKE